MACELFKDIKFFRYKKTWQFCILMQILFSIYFYIFGLEQVQPISNHAGHEGHQVLRGRVGIQILFDH